MRTTLIAGLTAALLSAAAPAHAATFDVTKPADAADGACDADCSLREAVVAANAAPGPDSITLRADTYALSLGALDVTDGVTIAGDGADRSIVDAGGSDRAFAVAEGADARITGLTIRHGRTSGAGAGILNQGTLTLSDAVVADNSAVGGGGVHNLGVATLSGVTLERNASAESAAALSNYGSMTVTNSTVTGSVTGPEGVSVAGNAGTLALRNVTLAGTTGIVLGVYFTGQVTLVNTIVDGSCEGTLSSLGHNLERGHTCGLELPDADPLLEPLAGGTHGLGAGSPAIDAGDDAACPATDQRGVARPQGAHCDIGAVERAAPSQNTPAGADVTVSLGPVTITFAHVAVAGDTTVTASGSGPAPPAGFTVAGSYYELATTAQFDSAEVCFAYAAPPPSIAHFEAGAWRILATTRDTGSAVCAQVSSFSPFVLVRAQDVREQLADLIEQVVAASRLSPAAKALLLERLRSALRAFDAANPAQRRAACLALAAFTVLARAQGGHPEWTAAANRISTALGCR